VTTTAWQMSELVSPQIQVRSVASIPVCSVYDLEFPVLYVHVNNHQTSIPHKISSILIDVLQLIW
jgi:hypothetical protein